MDSVLVLFQTTLPGTVADVRPRVMAALQEQGFGVLTEIDVAATLQTKIGETIEPYWILGACNPVLAHRALNLVRAVGLLMPCNVALRGVEGGVEVSFTDPQAMFAMLPADQREALSDVVTEIKRCFTAANAKLAT